MSLPTKIIALESLEKRWGMSFSDIFLQFLNHDELRPVHGVNDEWMYFGPDEEHDPVELLLSEGKDKRIIFLQSPGGQTLWKRSIQMI